MLDDGEKQSLKLEVMTLLDETATVRLYFTAHSRCGMLVFIVCESNGWSSDYECACACDGCKDNG